MKTLLLTAAAISLTATSFASPLDAFKQMAADPALQQAAMQAASAAGGGAGTGQVSTLAAKAQQALSMAQATQVMLKANQAAKAVFSPKEQSAWQAFLASPEGASIMQKMPQMVQAMAPVVQQMMVAKGAK